MMTDDLDSDARARVRVVVIVDVPGVRWTLVRVDSELPYQ